MLKTNSKKARENAHQVFTNILYSYDDDGKELLESSMLENMIDQLLARSTDSKGRLYTAWYKTIQDAFEEAIVMDYWCYTSDARKELAAILEETEEEEARFDSEKIYHTLGAMMYREFTETCKKYGKDFINRYTWRY